MPAVTFRPSDSIAIANCLASISVGNDFVSLGRGAEEKRSFGVSTETNQWLVNLYLAIMTAMAVLSTRKECNARTLFDNDPNLWVESLALTRHSPGGIELCRQFSWKGVA